MPKEEQAAFNRELSRVKNLPLSDRFCVRLTKDGSCLPASSQARGHPIYPNLTVSGVSNNLFKDPSATRRIHKVLLPSRYPITSENGGFVLCQLKLKDGE